MILVCFFVVFVCVLLGVNLPNPGSAQAISNDFHCVERGQGAFLREVFSIEVEGC